MASTIRLSPKGTTAVARRRDLEASKGILISLIVLGHNYFFSRYTVSWFSFLYGFHVASFLLFPFVFRYDGMTRGTYQDRMYRILVPQAAFLILVIPIYYAMFVIGHPETQSEWLEQLPLALLLQTETQLEAITGFRHFWFLPAMAVLITMLRIVDNAKPWAVSLLVAMLAIWHVSAGQIDSNVFQYIPWGMAIVGFLFIPGLAVRGVHTWSEDRWDRVPLTADILLSAAWLLLSWCVFHYGLFMTLAGDPHGLVSGLRQPARLLFQDVFLLVSFFFVLRLGWRLRYSLFVALGRESLKIFLLSPLVWQVLWMAGGRQVAAESNVGKFMLVVLSYVVTLGASYGIARAIASSPLGGLVFPRYRPFAIEHGSIESGD